MFVEPSETKQEAWPVRPQQSEDGQTRKSEEHAGDEKQEAWPKNTPGTKVCVADLR